ncbi:MAG: L-threonylcarbamoyladenylate synthase [Pseudomonadota bacterium]
MREPPTSETTTFKTIILAPGDDDIARVAGHLAAGGIAALPSETVYGLFGDAGNPDAVAAIFAAKGRPGFNPLIAHVRDESAAQALAVFTQKAAALAQAFWPGPLTLVLPARPAAGVCDLARAGLDTVAVRVSAHPVLQRILTHPSLGGRALAGPSANRSGRISPTTAKAVNDELGGLMPYILDAGPTRVGLESTIVGFSADHHTSHPPVLLRPGTITAEALADHLGVYPTVPTSGDPVSAPGMLASHYAPRARVRLEAECPRDGEAWLGFGANPDMAPGTPTLSLSESGDLREAASRLYASLRTLDAHDVAGIAVAPIPEQGLGAAINDRLRRAAAPRPSNS